MGGTHPQRGLFRMKEGPKHRTGPEPHCLPATGRTGPEAQSRTVSLQWAELDPRPRAARSPCNGQTLKCRSGIPESGSEWELPTARELGFSKWCCKPHVGQGVVFAPGSFLEPCSPVSVARPWLVRGEK